MDSSITKKYVFMDRDGVINEERGDFTTTIDEWRWVPGALEGIRLLTEAGIGIIVVTNQSCIARGLQTEEGLATLHRFMLDIIRKEGGDIVHIYHCPHTDADNCDCRKPKAGLIFQAKKDYTINLNRSFLIGDSPRDIEAGKRAGTRTILIDNGSRTNNSSYNSTQPDYRVSNFLEAVAIVVRETESQRAENQ